MVAGGSAVSISVGSLAFVSAAVVVPQASFYSVPNYSPVRARNINQTTIINNYRADPVVSNAVIPNYSQSTNRYNFSNAPVTQMPHSQVIGRIQQNNQVATQATPALSANSLKSTFSTTKQVQPAQQTTVAPPKLTSKIVPANQVNAPASQVKFQPVEVKKNTKPATASPAVSVH